jgi:CDP-diacylglycerol--glycerol-3-phosphate 3-phosphatidyltransferase
VNLPNALTISRLVAVPVLMVMLAVNFPYHDQAAAGIFFLASITDVVDGNLARWQGKVTELGKFLDPLVDKIFVLSVLIALVQEGLLAAWVVVIIFSRELLITVLRSFRIGRGLVAATPFGKTKTVVQVVAVLLLILQRPYPQLTLAALLAVAAAVIFTIGSGLDYLWRFRQIWWGPELRPATPLEPLALGRSSQLQRIAERLLSDKLTVAVAESCTGGLLAGALTDMPGSSAWFKGGIVAYSDEVKRQQLQVPEELLEQHGAVSAEVARSMAESVRRMLDTDLGVSITGLAGPDAGATNKPVGLTHIWLDGLGQSEGRCFIFGGDRWQNRSRAVSEALEIIWQRVKRLKKRDKQTDFRL